MAPWGGSFVPVELILLSVHNHAAAATCFICLAGTIGSDCHVDGSIWSLRATAVPSLIDTNVLVYRHDRRFPDKQQRAAELLRAGVADGSVYLPHQAIVEFVVAVSRPLDGGPLLSPEDARREAEDLLFQFDVLYPDDDLVRVALRGAAAYQLSWFDAHLWAHAERYGMDVLFSEDFQDGRMYGTVQAVNPFAGS